MHTRKLLARMIALILSSAVLGQARPVQSASGGQPTRGISPAEATCAAFTVSGDPRSAAGATWSYTATDGGVAYDLDGILLLPAGAGPFPGVLISHGKGGTPTNYSAGVGRVMVGWGMAVIATMYTHAPDSADLGHLPDGGDGASDANVLRARKARDLLSCLGVVDLTRLAAHGHSMGAFVTGQLLGAAPDDFRAASHTAGGVSPGPNATTADAAAQIRTPYQLHHGDQDTVVVLALDQSLDQILTDHAVEHELIVYTGYDHQEIAADPGMLAEVRAWYRRYGVLEGGPALYLPLLQFAP
jgi:dienelactone hydrolase